MSLNNVVATTSPVLERSVSPTLLHRPVPTSSPNDAMAATTLNRTVALPCLDKVCFPLLYFADPLTFCTHTGIASHATTLSHTGSPSIGAPFFFVSEFMLTGCCYAITTASTARPTTPRRSTRPPTSHPNLQGPPRHTMEAWCPNHRSTQVLAAPRHHRAPPALLPR